MAISKAFGGVNGTAASASSISVTVDSTGYTHIFVHCKHEGSPSSGVTFSDNKSSPAFTNLTQVDHSNGDVTIAAGWVKIGVPGTSHTVTATFTASKPYRGIAVWLINADSGDIEVVNELLADDQSSSSTPETVNLGNLSNAGADSVVSFLAIGEYNNQTYTAGSGWALDADGFGGTDGAAQSRGAETTSSIPATITFDDNTMDWLGRAICFKEASSGHDLLADDVESASEVSAPAVGQEHSLTADDVESASEVTAPAVGQEHTLAADDVESASEVSAPSLSEIVGGLHNLLADDVESASEVTAPVVGQVHVLDANDVRSLSEVSVPTLNRPDAPAVIGGFPMVRRATRRRPRAVELPASEPAQLAAEIAVRPLEPPSRALVALEAARMADAKKTADAARERHRADLRARGKATVVAALSRVLERR